MKWSQKHLRFGRKEPTTLQSPAFADQRARAAAREADLAKLKVKQLKEKSKLEAKIAPQKAQLEAELAIQEAEHEAGRRKIEALLLKEDLDEFNLSDRMKERITLWEGTR